MKDTKIEWTDHTFNPWWGCARVSAACQHCYAESLAKRTGHAVWGKTADRRLFGDKHWAEPLRWNADAEQAGVPARVFCASMADVFEDRRDLDGQRERLWELIGDTPWLRWLLLTKRPEQMNDLTPWEWQDGWPSNVWAGTTVEDQAAADERIPHLVGVPAAVRFLSCEPLLGPVDLGLSDHRGHESDDFDAAGRRLCLTCSTDEEPVEWFVREPTPIDWVIAGGESGAGARPSQPAWFRSLRDQCQAGGVAFLFKQWGEWAPRAEPNTMGYELALERVGKKAAGRSLDGRTWDEVPAP